ncbi:MAG: glycosyltransferase family 2 protein [Phycisphaerales bacterium]
MGFFNTKPPHATTELPIYIFTAGRSCSEYVDKCLTSVLNQNYSNFRHIVVDDDSTDGTADIAKQLTKDSQNHTIIAGDQRRFWTGNACEFLKPNDDDVVVTLDLDDWLAHDNVLSTINNIYQHHQCWLTYGSYKHATPNVRSDVRDPFPKKVLKDRSFREYKWLASHLRTFKGFLWNNLNPKQALLDENGNLAKMAWDLGIMFPMMEMCPQGKIHFVKEQLYIYNDLNPLNDHKVDRSAQIRTENHFRSLPKYEVLDAEQYA